MRDELEARLARFEELERAMVDPEVLADPQRLSATAREHGTLARLALRYRQFVGLERQIADLQGMIGGTDHLTHRALRKGWSHWGVLGVIVVLGVAGVLLVGVAVLGWG